MAVVCGSKVLKRQGTLVKVLIFTSTGRGLLLSSSLCALSPLASPAPHRTAPHARVKSSLCLDTSLVELVSVKYLNSLSLSCLP